MINFRVRNLAAMVTQLQAAGVEVTVDPEPYQMDALPGCTTLKAILWSCGNLRAETHQSVSAGQRAFSASLGHVLSGNAVFWPM
jgi:hypothetical protein